MKIKSLDTQRKEMVFLISGIGMLVIIALILFFFSKNLTNKLEQAYSNTATNAKPEQINFEKYDEIIQKIFPDETPPTPSAPKEATTPTSTET